MRAQVVHAESERPLNVVVEISEFTRGNRIYPTMFFAYFQRMPVFDAFDFIYNVQKEENKETPLPPSRLLTEAA